MGFKKGFVYTIIIFLLASALLSLIAYTSENNQKKTYDFFVQSDAEVLLYRLDELTYLAQKSLGLSSNLYRNETSIILNITDYGFPLTNYSLYGMSRIKPLKSKLISDWVANTNTTLTMNISKIYNNGTLLILSDFLNYSQDNSDNESDMINITFANISDFSVLNISNISTWLYCLRPYNASSRTADEWDPGGTSNIITYYSDEISSSSGISTNFDPTADNSYSIMYNDSDGNWLATFHLDWISSKSRLMFWDETNYTYAYRSIRRENMRCMFNSSIILNYSAGSEVKLLIPSDVNLTYNNASVYTNLTLFKK